MYDISKQSLGIEDIFEDYATRPVPEKKRFSGLTQGMAWAGGAFCMAMFSVGGMLASVMSFVSFVTAVLLGSAILTAIGSLIGSIGARTHMASAFNARFALGVGGGKIFGLILAVSLFGWFSYQCNYFADSVIEVVKMFGFAGKVPSGVWAVVGGLLMMITVVVGFNGITMLANLGAPLLFLLMLTAFGILARQVDFSVIQEVSGQVAGGMSIAGGIVIVVGSYITGACIVSDLSRFSKKAGDAVAGCIIGFMIAFPLLLLLGGFFYYTCGTSDVCYALFTHCGLGMFVPFILVVSVWTTNDFNLYGSVLGISNALDDYIRLPRWMLALVVGVFSTLLGAWGIKESLTSFLNMLGALIPPVAAVIIADYYLYNRNSGLYAYENMDKLENFRGNTCFSAIVGILAGLLCNYANIGFLNALCSVLPTSIVAMLASVIALVIYNTVTRSGRVNV